MKYDFPKFGCYCESAHGQDNSDRYAIRLALNYGWQESKAIAFLSRGEDEAGTNAALDYTETLMDWASEAELYLNDCETRPFVYWGWVDGDFGLWPDIESAEEDCGFHSSKGHEYPPNDYEGEWLHISDGHATLYVRENGQDKEIWAV